MNEILIEGIPNTEVLTQIWREKLAEHYVDQPRLYSFLKKTNLDFKAEEGFLKVYFDVYNEAQQQWFELKMLPEITSHFVSDSGVVNVEIIPVLKEEKDNRIYIIDERPKPPIPFEMVETKNLVMDLELDIK